MGGWMDFSKLVFSTTGLGLFPDVLISQINIHPLPSPLSLCKKSTLAAISAISPLYVWLFLCMAFCDKHFVTNVLSEWSCKAHFIRWPGLKCLVAVGRLFKLNYPLLVFMLWGCDVKKWDSLIVCENQATQFGASHWCMSYSPTTEALIEDDIHFKMMGAW